MDATTTGGAVLPSTGSPSSRTSTPTTTVRPRPKIPSTLINSGSKDENDDGGNENLTLRRQHFQERCSPEEHRCDQVKAGRRKYQRSARKQRKDGDCSSSSADDRSSSSSPYVTSSPPPPGTLLPPDTLPCSSYDPPTPSQISSAVDQRLTQVNEDTMKGIRVNDVTHTSRYCKTDKKNGAYDEEYDVSHSLPFENTSSSVKPIALSVARTRSLVFPKCTTFSVLPIDLRTKTLMRRPVRSLKTDNQLDWETESLGSPIDERTFEDEDHSSRPNSENAVMQSGEELRFSADNILEQNSGKELKTQTLQLGGKHSNNRNEKSQVGKKTLGEGSSGSSVIRSFSLRQLKKLDRIVTSDGHQRTLPNGSSFRRRPQMATTVETKMEDEGVCEDPDMKDSFVSVPLVSNTVQSQMNSEMLRRSFPPATIIRGLNIGGAGTVDVDKSIRVTDQTSPVGKNVASSRFLTHPPVRERSLTREGGSLDSNGLGTLRDSVGGNTIQSSNINQSSICSLDSHISLSEEDASESVSYQSEGAVIEDEGLGRLDRKNSKNLKHKSKSDPSSEKKNENGDIASSLASVIYTQSSPILVEKEKRQFLYGDEDDDDTELKHETEDQRPSLMDSEVKGILRRGNLLEDQLSLSVKPPRARSTKRRPRAILSPTTEASELAGKRNNEKSGKSTDQDSAQRVVGGSSAQSSLVGGSSKGKPILPTSLTLPLVKNQYTVEADLPSNSSQPPVSLEIQSPSDETPSVGGRIRHDLGTQDFNLSPSHGGIKTMAQAIGGSVQELYRSASPKLKGSRTAPAPASPFFSPSLDALSLFEGMSDKDKRDFILQEFYSTEKQYVETLQMLVEKYMIPMKSQSVVDSSIVDEIFYKINEIYMHHATFIAFLDRALILWNSQSTIGDVIYKNFSKQTVIDSYISFIEHFPRSEKVLDEVSTKSSFQKLIEQCERETRTKLPLKAQIVKPAQRIPRYELLLKRLLDNTPSSHPDFPLLQQAERAIHDLALRINSVMESKHEDDLQETLKKLELLLITDLASSDRLYLRHDMVTVPTRKDQCCVWLFSDLIIISSVKRKSTSVNRRTSLLLQSLSGHDFVENTKHKVWLKVPLDAIEMVQAPNVVEAGRQLADKQELESDYETLGKMAELSTKLRCPHQVVDDAVKEIFSQINRQLTEHQLRTPPPEEHSLELIANTRDNLVNITLVFPSADKKTSWETAFLSSKQKIVQVTDKQLPEFLQSLPITKTRAGMQFSCAAATEPSSTRLDRAVLVCNSDGYVGHMCLLNLFPEPIVTLNTPVPGCNSRILCICAVPPHAEPKRKRSGRQTGLSFSKTPQIRIEEIRESDEEDEEAEDKEEEEGGSDSDSGTNTNSNTEHEDDDDTEDGEIRKCSNHSSSASDKMRLHKSSSSSSISNRTTNSESATNSKECSTIDPNKSTVWLGTEDGCIQIFASTENIKTTKSKIKIQRNASVLAIVYLNCRVYVSIANGDIVVYKKNKTDGTWDYSEPEVITLSTSAAPISRMIAVNDRIWCSCQNDILVVKVPSVDIAARFTFHQDSKQGINCLASQGQGVWITGKNSSKIALYHATTYEQLMEVNVSSAVAQKLQNADDIIRQHKMACLRITALLCCKNLLWIGTSAGIILTLPLPNIKTSSIKPVVSTPPPPITGLPFGHTGHVRFLTCVETDSSSSSSSSPPSAQSSSSSGFYSTSSSCSSLSSSSSSSSAKASSMLVISGGDGYEDFSASFGSSDAAGRDDSTNHLLLWHA